MSKATTSPTSIVTVITNSDTYQHSSVMDKRKSLFMYRNTHVVLSYNMSVLIAWILVSIGSTCPSLTDKYFYGCIDCNYNATLNVFLMFCN